MIRLLHSIRRWRRESISRRQLARLDSRMLADIGMVRDDIGRVVHLTR